MSNEMTLHHGAFSTAVASLIAEPTPVEAVKTRQGRGGQQLKYVSTSYIIGKLNEIFGHAWSFETEMASPWELAAKNQQVAVKGRLSVHTPQGLIVKEQFGSAEVKVYGDKNARHGEVIDVADDLKAAASDALKKCASLFGIAADVYAGGYQSQASAPQGAEPIEETGGQITFIPADIKVKIGVKANGQPWTRTSIMHPDGRSFGTFDGDAGQRAAAAMRTQSEVEIEYYLDGKFLMIRSLKVPEKA